MHFKLAARVALDGDHKELVARQRQITTEDPDPFGWLTSLLGGGDATSTTTRTTVTRGATTTPLLPTVPINSLINTRTTSSTIPTSTRTSTSIPSVITPTQPPLVASSSQQTTTVFSTASGDTSQANANDSNTTSSGGLPSVVIGIIVAASVIFGLILIALIARKIFQTRRRNKRNTWAGTSVIAPFGAPTTEKALPPPPPMENNTYPSYPAYPPPVAAVGPASSFANPMMMNAQPYSPAAPSSAGYPAPYPYGNNNAYQSATTNAGAFNAADLAGPVVIQHTPPTPTSAVAVVSIVKRTFVPSLPDELSISNGDQVRVLSAYDDGWALCEKMSTGEKGVVPQECLEVTKPTGGEDSRLNRNSSLRRPQDQTN